MKHLFLAIGIACVFVTGVITPASAEITCNIAVIDMFQVSEGYERYLASRRILEARKAELQEIVDAEEKSVLSLIEELEAVRATTSQEDLSRRRAEIEGRDRELRDFVGASNAQFRDDLDSLQFRTKNEIESVVRTIAAQRGFQLVLEKNMTLYSADALDITPAIVADLNLRFKPIAVAPPPSRPRASTPATSTPTPQAPGRGWPFRPDR